MSPQYTQAEVRGLLEKKKLLMLATSGPDSLRARCMFFASDGDLNIYMMSTIGSVKIKEIQSHPDVSLLVLKEDDILLNTVEVEIQGKAGIVVDADEKLNALKLLAARSPLAHLALDSDAGPAFAVIKVIPKTIVYRVYGEAATGIGATVLKF